MDDEALRRLGDAAVHVATGLELEAVLQNVADAATALLDARYAALGVVGEDEHLSAFVHSGFDGDIDKVGHLPRGHGILGLLIRDPRPLRLSDLSTHPQAHGFPDGHPPMRSFVGAPIRVRDRVYGNLYITEKRDGTQFTAADEQLALVLAATAGAAIDNAIQYRATRHRERSLDAVREITGAILRGFTSDHVLTLIAERARQLVDADLAVLCVPRSSDIEDLVEVRAAAGPAAASVARTVVPADRSLSRQVMLSGHVVITDQVPVELRAAMAPDSDTMVIGAPLVVRDEPFGALALVARTFDDGDRGLTELFAEQASVILDYTRTREELERLLVIEERERIGRDLHDTVIQRLFATGLELQAVALRLEQTQDDLADRLGAAVDRLDETIVQIRTTIFALQPSGLGAGATTVDAMRIREQVVGIVAEASRALGFDPELVFPGDPSSEIPVTIAEHLLVVVREGLANVARHAHASQVTVTVGLDSEIVARVADDGVGPTGTPWNTGGYGVANMRERAHAVGGHLDLSARREGGTVLEWRVTGRHG